MGQEGVSGGQVVEVIDEETTGVFVAVAAVDEETTGVFVARTRTETWPTPRARPIRRRP